MIYRLGDEPSVRFPRHKGAIGQARKEMAWPPRLAPHLPLAIPVPVAVGEPAFGYPWAWAVARWLPGLVVVAALLWLAVDERVPMAVGLLLLNTLLVQVAHLAVTGWASVAAVVLGMAYVGLPPVILLASAAVRSRHQAVV